MKKYLILLIPALTLMACSDQKEITYEKAEEMMTAIHENAAKVTNYTFTGSNKGGIGKGSNKVEVDLSYKLIVDGNNVYSYIKGNNSGVSYDFEYYRAANSKYEEVTYVRYFDETKQEYIKAVEVKKDNPNYADAFASYASIYNRPINVCRYYQYFDIKAVKDSALEGDTVKFYSSKEGNLTIKAIANSKSSDPEQEITTKGTEIYNFDNNLFVSSSNNTESSFGNKWESKIKVEYKNDKVEIPTDFETYVKHLD